MGQDEPERNRSATLLCRRFRRHEQTFPDADAAEIERMRRFGEVRTYQAWRALFETGKPGPGMFVVLSGHVAITQRDGLGHVTPVIDQGPGQFLAEIGQLSGRAGAGRRPRRRRRRDAADPAGAAARAAGRRSRSRRAHHARADPAPGQPDPGRRRRAGADRVRRIRPAWCACRAFSPATAIRIICSIPTADRDAAELIARYSPSPEDWPLVVTPDGTVLRNPERDPSLRARSA